MFGIMSIALKSFYLLCLVSMISGSKIDPLCPDLPGYNITQLTTPKHWQIDFDGQCLDDYGHQSKCTFYFTFCHTLEEAQDCVNASVCQLNDQTGNLQSIGTYIYDPFTPKEVNGFYAFFGARQIINPYTNQSCESTLSMEFDCDKDAIWLIEGNIGEAPTPILYDGISAGKCDIFIKFAYAGACHRIIPPKTTTIGPPLTTTPINPPPSKLCVPPTGYDIEVLSYPPYWVFNIKEGCSIEEGSSDSCSINVAFCKPIESGTPKCEGGSSCVFYPNQPQFTRIIGNFTNDPFTENDQIKGFQADYPPGVTVTNKYSKKTCLPVISVVFECDENSNWELPEKDRPGVAPPIKSFIGITELSCNVAIVVPYSGACKEKSGKISFGSVLIIIFVIISATYLLGGIAWNALYLKENGARVIPNYDFWKNTVWNNAKIGFKFVTCRGTGDDGYSPIMSGKS